MAQSRAVVIGFGCANGHSWTSKAHREHGYLVTDDSDGSIETCDSCGLFDLETDQAHIDLAISEKATDDDLVEIKVHAYSSITANDRAIAKAREAGLHAQIIQRYEPTTVNRITFWTFLFRPQQIGGR